MPSTTKARKASERVIACSRDGSRMRAGRKGIKFCPVCVEKNRAKARKERVGRHFLPA